MAVAAGGLVALALARLAWHGWAPITTDDARYLYAGSSFLDGDGLRHPLGWFFAAHGPVFPTFLAVGARLFPGDVFTGARVVAFALSAAGLVGAATLAGRLAGARAAVATATAIALTPLTWRLLPSMGIDLPLAALVVATLLVVDDGRREPRRWAIAGAVLGVAILVKETVAPLVLLPLVVRGTMPHGRWRALARAFTAAVAATAGWWWLAVLVRIRQVFPFNALSGVEDRPAYAWVRSLDERHFAPLVVLSAIALGVALADATRAVRPRTALRVGLAATVVAAVVGAQVTTIDREPDQSLSRALAGFVAPRLAAGERVVMTKRFSYELAVRVDDVQLVAVPARGFAGAAPSGDIVWRGVRADGWPHAIARSELVDVLDDRGTRFLVFTGPHSLSARDLASALARSDLPELSHVATITAGRQWAEVFRVAPGHVTAETFAAVASGASVRR